MIGLREQLEKELYRLQKIKEITAKSLGNAPEGYLRLSKSQGCTQYYLRRESSNNGTYISKKDIQLVEKLAQKSYDEKVLAYVEKTTRHISNLLKTYKDNKVEEIYISEHPERQRLITPVETTFEQRLAEWISIPYAGKGFLESSPVILTNSGTRVRSKSEKIIADYFEAEGIKYKYECPINLKPYGTIYPDFTFLSRKNGREIYWEHEGMLDNPEYAKSAVQKIELYEKNCIYPGENLILTFETSTATINTELIKCLTSRYLK